MDSMVKNLRKPYNIKLPREFQGRFLKPYDKFLVSILTLSENFTSDVINTSVNLIKGPKEWMVWLGAEDRQVFHQVKDQTMPQATQAQFINALLLMHERQKQRYIMISRSRVSLCKIAAAKEQVCIKKGRVSYVINGVELLNTSEPNEQLLMI